MKFIALSKLEFFEGEAELINQLFEAGLDRYHLYKAGATEQNLAEILEKVDSKYLSQISLHSHFHLVLAYGVGGIHYSKVLIDQLGSDFRAKVELYQGFGIKVSCEKPLDDEISPILDYIIDLKNTSEIEIGIFQDTFKHDGKVLSALPSHVELLLGIIRSNSL